MSAYFILINRDQSLVSSALAKKMFKTLEHFGEDNKQLIVKDNFAIGYQSFWTVPEEHGEQQPLYDSGSGTWLVFYGRIDNRQSLISELQDENGMQLREQLSDAQLLLRYLLCFDDTRLANIIGPFVFVHFDPSSNRVLAARDAMGGRHQAFHITGQRILIASFDLALAADPSVGYRLNPEKRIRLLCNIMESQPSSTLVGVTPLKPGEKLSVQADVEQLSCFYLPNPKNRISLADDQAYADEFRRLLDQAVERRLRSIGGVGSMLSGGMDSVPITISAQQILRACGARLTAFSWVFDNYPEADERSYSTQLCRQLQIEQQLIVCDEVWPKFDTSTYVNPTLPYLSPYSEYNQALFSSARAQGVSTLLSGIGGDMLYTGSGQILLELFKAGRWRDCWREARSLSATVNNHWHFCKYYVLSSLPLVRSYLQRKRAKSENSIDYLSDTARQRLKVRAHWLKPQIKQALRREQYRNVVDAFEGEDANYGKHMESKFRLERRYPMRDRDLVEFLLAIPSDQLFSLGVNRPIVKRAYATELSEALKHRNSKTNFFPVIRAGIEKDREYLRWLECARDNYIQDVNNCYFDDVHQQKHGFAAILWRIAYHEYWKSVCYNPIASELGQ